MRLKDRVAVITGGGKGIGKGIALRFAQEGADIVIFDVDSVSGEQAVAEIKRSGRNAAAYDIDITRQTEVEGAMNKALEQFGSIDILVNNAGIAKAQRFLETSLESWETTLKVNLTGTFLCSQVAARMMMPKKWGRILNIASVSGLIGPPAMAAYSATKGGVIALTRAMAVELADHGIRVNAVAPGAVLTELAMTVMNTEEVRKAKARSLPCYRLGTVEDIAQAALYFCSPEADFVTGQILAVDGGATAIGYNSFDYNHTRE